jgi:hypothetical protein
MLGGAQQRGKAANISPHHSARRLMALHSSSLAPTADHTRGVPTALRWWARWPQKQTMLALTAPPRPSRRLLTSPPSTLLGPTAPRHRAPARPSRKPPVLQIASGLPTKRRAPRAAALTARMATQGSTLIGLRAAGTPGAGALPATPAASVSSKPAATGAGRGPRLGCGVEGRSLCPVVCASSPYDEFASCSPRLHLYACHRSLSTSLAMAMPHSI